MTPAAASPFKPGAFLNEREIKWPVHGMATADDFMHAARSQFTEVNGLIAAALPDWRDPTVVYRGHTDSAWGLHSTLFRALSDAKAERISERDLADAEKRVIQFARRPIAIQTPARGEKLGLNLSDGQLLAVLQHHATPTRFIDVTQDARVGLYFACEKSDSADGRLFFIALRAGDPARAGSDYSSSEPWLALGTAPNALPWSKAVRGSRTAESDWTSRVFLVDGGGLDPRMSAQKGAFLVGGCNRSYSSRNIQYSGRWLTAAELLELSSLAIHFRKTLQRRAAGNWTAFAWTIRIPARLKAPIRALLALDGVSEESIYPDYDAFKQLGIERAKAVN
jgi:hypothetical protein